MFIYARHAMQKMDALGIDIREVEKAIRAGMKWKEEGSEKWHARMAGVEAVFIRQGKDLFIITVYMIGR